MLYNTTDSKFEAMAYNAKKQSNTPVMNKSDLDKIFDKVKDETAIHRSSKRSLVSFGKEINEQGNIMTEGTHALRQGCANYTPFQNGVKA